MLRLDTLSARPALQSPRPICLWGDSQGEGASASSVGTRVSSVLSALSGRFVLNNGVGGDSSTEVLNRVLQMPKELEDYIHVFFPGAFHENMIDPTTGVGYNPGTYQRAEDWEHAGRTQLGYNTTIDRMMARIPHGQKLILTPTTANRTNDRPGGLLRPERLLTVAHIQANYPDNYLDVLPPLLALSDGSPQDLSDVADEIVPASARADNIHLFDPGHAAIAQLIHDGIEARGWR